jgi:GDP-mannose 4,6-dehydratase
MKVLITGITGMVGSHLADYILEHQPGVEVHGLLRWRSPRDNIAHLEDRVTLHYGDLLDVVSLWKLFETQFDRIFHLAAQSFVPYSFDAPVSTLWTNVIGTANLLNAILASGPVSPLIHICSSSEVYGQVRPDEVPITEDQPLRPMSVYAVSKAAMDLLAFQYWQTYRLRTIRTRMFTHTGPRRGDVFVASAFAKQIVEVETGKRNNPIYVGNLHSVRTWADVRDAVRAYWLLLEHCTPGEAYNIGGERTTTVGEMLDILKGLARVPITHQISRSLLRASDVTLQIPDTSKFRAATGWEPEIPLEQTLRDLLEWHRRRIRG